jgi:Uncharacterized protein conserved in bacteria (DUF2252)
MILTSYRAAFGREATCSANRRSNCRTLSPALAAALSTRNASRFGRNRFATAATASGEACSNRSTARKKLVAKNLPFRNGPAGAKGRCWHRADAAQAVIGNPAHDLIRLGLSLATAVRSSNLPGNTTAHMIESMIDGYGLALVDKGERKRLARPDAKPVRRLMQLAPRRRWKNFAKECIENVRPSIPRGDNFWEPTREEKRALTRLVQTPDLRRLVTALHSRDDDAPVKLLDAAYWVKGCSSLGRLRHAVLVGVKKR